jgi:hypothetical protein
MNAEYSAHGESSWLASAFRVQPSSVSYTELERVMLPIQARMPRVARQCKSRGAKDTHGHTEQQVMKPGGSALILPLTWSPPLTLFRQAWPLMGIMLIPWEPIPVSRQGQS